MEDYFLSKKYPKISQMIMTELMKFEEKNNSLDREGITSLFLILKSSKDITLSVIFYLIKNGY